MGRRPNPDLTKMWRMVENGALLENAWAACNKPTSWGNVTRLHKQRTAAASTAAGSSAESPRASRGEASSSTVKAPKKKGAEGRKQRQAHRLAQGGEEAEDD